MADREPVRLRGRVDGNGGDLGMYMTAGINPASLASIR